MSTSEDSDWPYGEIISEDNSQLTISLGSNLTFEDAEGRIFFQKDYRVAGEIWQVHKGDADPFPSRPHAHCVDGRTRFVGLKLHLGTRQLFDGPRPTEMFLHRKPFARLIELIRPKFPDIILPLPDRQPVPARN